MLKIRVVKCCLKEASFSAALSIVENNVYDDKSILETYHQAIVLFHAFVVVSGVQLMIA